MNHSFKSNETPLLSVADAVNKAPVYQLNWPLADQHNIEVWVSRTDQIHPHFGGNKFFKLFYHLKEFKQSSFTKILSFGGAFSNHIYALAGVGQAFGIPTVGVIRGERPEQLSPTLLDAQSLGMTLDFINRQDYKNKTSQNILDALRSKHGDIYIIPEGGDDQSGSLGCKAWGQVLAQTCPIKPDAVFMAVGTGGTISGFSSGFCSDFGADDWASDFHGYLVLKGTEDEYRAMEDKILRRSEALMAKEAVETAPKYKPRIVLHTDAHCGGYAKQTPELSQFIGEFECETGVPLDPVYTGKVMFAVSQQIKQNYWPKGTKLLFIHTGGLQGKRGLQHRGYQ